MGYMTIAWLDVARRNDRVGNALARRVDMAGRQMGTAVAAAIYGIVHYAVVAGELVRGAGWRDLPYSMQKVLELCFLCSLVIVLGFLVPKILRFNIAVSKGILAGLNWCGGRANILLEGIRRALIAAAEKTAASLRGLEVDPSGSDDPHLIIHVSPPIRRHRVAGKPIT